MLKDKNKDTKMSMKPFLPVFLLLTLNRFCSLLCASIAVYKQVNVGRESEKFYDRLKVVAIRFISQKYWTQFGKKWKCKTQKI